MYFFLPKRLTKQNSKSKSKDSLNFIQGKNGTGLFLRSKRTTFENSTRIFFAVVRFFLKFLKFFEQSQKKVLVDFSKVVRLGSGNIPVPFVLLYICFRNRIWAHDGIGQLYTLNQMPYIVRVRCTCGNTNSAVEIIKQSTVFICEKIQPLTITLRYVEGT